MSKAAVRDHIFLTKFQIAMTMHVTDTETDNLILVFIEEIPDQERPYLSLVRLHQVLCRQGAYLSWEEDKDGQGF